MIYRGKMSVELVK